MGRGPAKGNSPKKPSGKKASAVRRSAQKRVAKAVRRSSGASPEAEAARLARKLDEAQARQAATSEILRIISQSTGNVQPVFDAIVLAAIRLLGCDRAHFLRCDATTFFPVAVAGPEGLLEATASAPVPIDPDTNLPSHAIVARKDTYLPDWSKIDLPAFERSTRNLRGTNSSLLLPMLREGECIGVLALASKRVNNFDDSDIALAKSFRDKALIAIENARLFNETKEALERQTATADILKVIASSPSDVQPVFEAIASSANRLLGGHSTGVMRAIDGVLHLAAFTPINPAADAVLKSMYPMPVGAMPFFELLARGEPYQVPDMEAIPVEPPKQLARARGYRSLLWVPLMNAGQAIGIISVSRAATGRFALHEVQLLQTFADQAVIAIENVRLFNETREALERQTATADILKVIASSPADVQPVFDAIVASATRLIGGYSTAVIRFVDGMAHLAAFTPMNPQADAVLKASLPGPTAGFQPFDYALRGVPTQIEDTEVFADGRLLAISRVRGFRSALYAPLMSGSLPIGVIGVTRIAPGKFAPHHVQLLQTFADQAVIAIENVRLFNETQEALARQTATSDVLRVISSSVADTTPVFEKILDSCENLFATEQLGIFLVQGDGQVHPAAWRGAAFDAVIRTLPSPLEHSATGIVIRNRGVLHFPNIALAKDVPHTVERLKDQIGDASMAWAPMLGEDHGVGSIAVMRQPPDPFSDKELALLKTFADQAVIAIQNTRLFNETREALERQTATADILKVIASSPSDVQPVFDAIAERANKLAGGHATTVLRIDGDMVELAAFTPVSEESDAVLRAAFPIPVKGRQPFEMVLRGETSEISDTEMYPDLPIRDLGRARGFRSRLLVPLKSDSGVIGAISVTRVEPGRFSPHHMQLLQSFADQAVIAIQNTRLFNETQEALQSQTATADILKVIARSPSDAKPVFDQILNSIKRLIKSDERVIILAGDDGLLRVGAAHSPRGEDLYKMFPRPLEGSAAEVVIRERRLLAFADVANDPIAPPSLKAIAPRSGARSFIMAPLLSENRAIGAITITRQTVNPFNEKECALLSTFADQAVIAIENTRLFNETREALERQTATADILKVIASSPDDVQPVFEAIAQRSNRIVDGFSTAVLSIVDETAYLSAFTPTNPEADATLKSFFPRPLSTVGWGEAIMRGDIFQVIDTAVEIPQQSWREMARLRGWRSALWVPLLRDGNAIGAIGVTRAEPGAFAGHLVQLLQTFADQAVIAIENVRLFNETQEALERQTATADVLNVIGRSPTDAAPVFDVIGERAEKLCNAEISVVSVLDGDLIKLAGIRGISREGVELFRSHFPMRPDRQTVTARTIKSGTIVHIGDVLADPAYDNKGLAAQTGYRSCLGVPMHNKGQVVGAIFVARTEPGLFSNNQIQLLQIFADQAVIAIQNTRLFNETREALERQTATADILKVIASSPDDVQPVFEAIAERSNRIANGRATAVYSLVDGILHLMAFTPTSPEADARLRAFFPRRLSQMRWGEAIGRGEKYEIEDMEDPSIPQDGRDLSRLRGYRGLLLVPLVQDRQTIGAISVTRAEPGRFADHHVELLKTFADQAVIAISNVELFNEVQKRTQELSQSLDDLRAAQDRLVQTEKLASLGQLTAGIAHEIKNPLNFVNNFSALSAELTDELNDMLKAAELTGKMREEVGELTRLLKENLEKVVQHGKRADSIVKNMLLHSRAGSGEQRNADVNALVDESLSLAYHGARAEKSGFNITLQRDFDAAAGTAELFPQEITRALLNLISNGFYAATKRLTENGEAGFEPTLLATTKGLGNSVEIRIRDNGAGIPPEVKEKMFNPFFTTKPAGEGTGLGLSMTHDIVVKQHGGRIDVETEPGQFTEFVIVLPRAGNLHKAG